MKSSIIAASALLAGLCLPALAEDNKSRIDQIGTDHTANVVQTSPSTKNTATVKQAGGTGDNAGITQGGALNTNLSTIYQYGDNEDAVTTQDGTGNFSTSVHTQAGADNTSTTHQGGSGNVNDSLVRIQAGTNNLIAVDQFGDDSFNDSTISTFSHDSSVNITQSGAGSANASSVISGAGPSSPAYNSTVSVTQN
jgi:hypothetical protein